MSLLITRRAFGTGGPVSRVIKVETSLRRALTPAPCIQHVYGPWASHPPRRRSRRLVFQIDRHLTQGIQIRDADPCQADKLK